MEEKRPLQSVPDDDLLSRLAELISQSRGAEADIVAHIAEVEERGLYAREAFPSMFVYCMDVLHLSEAEAYLRIAAARASRKHPMLLAMLADGRIHLTAIGLLVPRLTPENCDWLLERAAHRSKRQILELIAEISPRADVPLVVRKLPERRTLATAALVVAATGDDGHPMLNLGSEPAFQSEPKLAFELRPDGVAGAPESAPVANAPASGAVALASLGVVEPLSPGRYKVQFTASAELCHKLERLRALMRSRAPGEDLAALIEQAVTEKLERLEARRFGQAKAPRKALAKTKADSDPGRGLSPSSRYIPAAVRRAVRKRDGDRCRYMDGQGRRCPERNWLEFHHGHPFALGGEHSVSNIGLLCRAHNAYLAERDFGKDAMARHRRPRDPAPDAPA